MMPSAKSQKQIHTKIVMFPVCFLRPVTDPSMSNPMSNPLSRFAHRGTGHEANVSSVFPPSLSGPSPSSSYRVWSYNLTTTIYSGGECITIYRSVPQVIFYKYPYPAFLENGNCNTESRVRSSITVVPAHI